MQKTAHQSLKKGQNESAAHQEGHASHPHLPVIEEPDTNQSKTAGQHCRNPAGQYGFQQPDSLWNHPANPMAK